MDENATRNYWLKGKIIETFPGSDGIVRIVKIKTIKGVVTRPVTKMLLIKAGGPEEC